LLVADCVRVEVWVAVSSGWTMSSGTCTLPLMMIGIPSSILSMISLPEATFSFRRSCRRTALEGLVGSLSDDPLPQKWASTCASASSSYDRSLHENVITGVSCRRMDVSGWKMIEDK
jgi:hypothetical protein